MNDIKKLISDIELLLSSNDLTDNPHSRALAEKYVQKVSECNSKAEECQILLDRNMILEAEEIASAVNPPLPQFANLLDFSRKKEFEELFQIYEWPPIPQLRTDIITTLQTRSEGVSELLPLLNAYRKVARSTDNAAKIKLLRKIVVIDSQNAEWKNTLEKLETERLNQLYNTAKEAIIGKDYTQLQEVWTELSSNSWRVPVMPQVMNKIDSVLKEKHEADLREQSIAYVNAINTAYSAQDFRGLSKALKTWQFFLAGTNFKADEVQAAQIREAENYFNEQKDLQERQEQFEALTQKLEKCINEEAPLQELNHIYNQLQNFGSDIPEQLYIAYCEYRSAAESIERRKKFLYGAAVAAGLIIIGGLAFWLTATLVLMQQEKQWSSRLNALLASQPAEETLKLIEEMKTTSPRVAARPRILEIEKKAEEQQKDEQRKKQEFAALSKVQLQLLKEFQKNLTKIEENRVRLRTLIVDQNEKKVFEEIESIYQKGMTEFKLQCEDKYQEILDQIKQLQKRFYMALSDCNIGQAEDSFNKIEQLKAQADSMKRLISPDLLMSGRKIINDTGSMQNVLESEKTAFSVISESLNDVRRASSFEDLKQKVEKFIEQYPERQQAKNVRKLREALQTVPRFTSANKNDSVFARDFKRRQELYNSNKAAMDEMNKYFARIGKIYREKPLYAVVMSSQGNYYDFYYYKIKSKSRMGQERTWELNCLKDDDQQHVTITFKTPDGRRISALNRSYVDQDGFLEYPMPGEIDKQTNLAPHLLFLNWFSDELQKCSVMDFEKLVLASWNKFMTDSLIAPKMKLDLARLIFGITVKNMPYRVEYKTFLAKLEELEKDLQDKKYNWLQSYTLENRDTHEFLRKELNLLLPNTSFGNTAAARFNYDLLECALNRSVEMAGYVRNVNGELVLSGNTSLSEGELWLPQEQAPYFRIVGHFKNGKITLFENAKAQISPLQVLFTPVDGKNTAELKAAFEKRALEEKVKNITWPDTWPVSQENK